MTEACAGVHRCVTAGRALRAWNRRCARAQPCTLVAKREMLKCLLYLNFKLWLAQCTL